MNPSPESLPTLPWPPLISGSRLSAWVKLRDVLLTLLAWCALCWLLRDPIYVAYDYLRPPVLKLTTAHALDVGFLLWRLRYFLIAATILVVWLSLWAVIERRRLRAAMKSHQPQPLTLSEHIARFSLAESAVLKAREFKITNVQFQEDGAIAGFEEVT